MAIISFTRKKPTFVTGSLPLPDGTVRAYRAENPGGLDKIDKVWREECVKCAAGGQIDSPVKGIWLRSCAWPNWRKQLAATGGRNDN